MTNAMLKPPEEAKNQSSIDRILKLQVSLAERQRVFELGLKEAKRQGIVGNGVTVHPKLDEIKLCYVDSMGRYQYRDSIRDSKRAIAAVKANPTWFTADGVYEGSGSIAIYATATSPDTMLNVVANTHLHRRLGAGLGFGLKLSAVENVLQTIAHEVAHHAGLGHADVSLYNREYTAIKNYRAQL